MSNARTITVTTIKVTLAITVLSAIVGTTIQYLAGAELNAVHFTLAIGMPMLIVPLAAVPLMVANMRLHELRSELERLVRTDPLTGLPNRRAFFERAQDMFGAHRGGAVAMMMIDVDGFKRINDTHGHDAGDAYLKGVSDLLAATAMPGADRRNRIVGRLGGEEFAVALTGLDRAGCAALAGRLCDAVRGFTCQHQGIAIATTVSVGFAMRRLDDDVDTVLQRADRAVYAAKREGRDRWCAAPVEPRVAAFDVRDGAAEAAPLATG